MRNAFHDGPCDNRERRLIRQHGPELAGPAPGRGLPSYEQLLYHNRQMTQRLQRLERQFLELQIRTPRHAQDLAENRAMLARQTHWNRMGGQFVFGAAPPLFSAGIETRTQMLNPPYRRYQWQRQPQQIQSSPPPPQPELSGLGRNPDAIETPSAPPMPRRVRRVPRRGTRRQTDAPARRQSGMPSLISGDVFTRNPATGATDIWIGSAGRWQSEIRNANAGPASGPRLPVRGGRETVGDDMRGGRIVRIPDSPDVREEPLRVLRYTTDQIGQVLESRTIMITRAGRGEDGENPCGIHAHYEFDGSGNRTLVLRFQDANPATYSISFPDRPGRMPRAPVTVRVEIAAPRRAGHVGSIDATGSTRSPQANSRQAGAPHANPGLSGASGPSVARGNVARSERTPGGSADVANGVPYYRGIDADLVRHNERLRGQRAHIHEVQFNNTGDDPATALKIGRSSNGTSALYYPAGRPPFWNSESAYAFLGDRRIIFDPVHLASGSVRSVRIGFTRPGTYYINDRPIIVTQEQIAASPEWMRGR